MKTQGLPYEVAARRVQVLVTGRLVREMWECRTCGALYDREGSAAYCHASSRPCQSCGKPADKSYAHCESCRGKLRRERWDAMPEIVWDGEAALAIYDSDQYFFDADDLADYCGDEGIDVADLMLVLCKHVRPRTFSLDDFLDDLLPDDQGAADFGIDVVAAEKAVNDATSQVAALVWEPIGKRPTLESLKRHLKE